MSIEVRTNATVSPGGVSADPTPPGRRTDLDQWIELSRSAYLSNLRFFRSLAGSSELGVVVKSNAYGHGLGIVSGWAEDAADSYCVHSLDEALALRALGRTKPILILGPVPETRLTETLGRDLRVVVFRPGQLRAWSRLLDAGEPSKAPASLPELHLKLETGTHRQGLDGAELGEALRWIGAHPGLPIRGVYTHFANVEDTIDQTYAHHQLEVFRAMRRRLEEAGLGDLREHAAASSAVLIFADARLDMVRLGISQYGLWPSRETFLSFVGRHPGSQNALQPVLSWKTRVTQLKWIPAGADVGYGCTYQTTRRTRLAVLPVGYADGFDRGLSNRGHVLIRGRRAPVRGRVCMNLIMVDATDIDDAEVGDEVVLIGEQGDQRLRAEDHAALLSTISYEIVARLDRAIPRFAVP